MCGIAGWFQRDNRPVDLQRLQRMTDAVAHRGPDDFGVWSEPSIGLGHRRLAIRDLSPLGRQPMSDADARAFVTYNGEIYNDDELRRRLLKRRAIAFKSNCDAETIPYAYLEWGLDAFAMLEGMFAIALWDRQTKTLHLARDGIGIKPLYYAVTDSAVVFGSEPKALFASGLLSGDLDPESLHALLATGHSGPAHALFVGMRQVPPGSVVSIDASTIHTTAFWMPRRKPEIYDMGEAVEALRSTLADVVQSQLISDVTLGVLQSGGIDSTVVTLAASALGVDVPVFTASFSDKTYDETGLATSVARASRLRHEIVAANSEFDVEHAFRDIVHAYDGQGADTGAMAFYQLAGAVRRRTTVVLSGDGGDEFFAGYDTYRATRFASALPLWLLRPGAALAGAYLYGLFPDAEGRVPKSMVAARLLLGLGAGDAPPHLQWRRLVPHFMLSQIYGTAMKEVAAHSPYARYAAFYDGAEGNVLARALAADQQYHLQSVLQKVDTMSMAHALEVRVPLLDRRFMDLAGRIDASLLLPQGGPPKYALRQLAARLGAPGEITAGRKMGFNAPIAAMMRGPLGPLGDHVLDREADVLAPYLSPDGVRALWRAHRERRANHAFALWPLLTLATYRAGEASSAREPALRTVTAA